MGLGFWKGLMIVIIVFLDVSECCIPHSVSDVSCSPATLATVILQTLTKVEKIIILSADYQIHMYT